MAIDDNTVYGLTGAQIKELPELTAGNYKVLSDADVNYPTDNPTSIRACMLPNGIYFKPSGLTVSVGATLVGNYPIPDNAVIIVAGAASGTNKWVIYAGPGSYPPMALLVSSSGGMQYLGRMPQVVDNLTSTDTFGALSANQGRALKGLIDTLDTDLQSQIDAIVASSDVKDIVGTKADLNSYDTTTLGDNDIIKVLADESQSNATTYYRWSVSGAAFTLIGAEGPYYTKSQTDTLVNAKADASTTYTKSEVDTALNGKADNAALSNYATTAAMNTALASKANTADVYTKTQVDTALDGKADAPAAGTTYVTDTAMATALATKADTSTTYTKTEVDTALAGKASTDEATTSASGLMSSSDKTKLNNVYSMVTMLNTPTTSASAVSVPYNIRNASTGSDVSTSVTLPAATTSKAGVLTAADKVKINDMPTITMTTTDPGEGSSLAANNFVAVYSA